MNSTDQKKLGAFYTPADLAIAVTARALEPHIAYRYKDNLGSLRVCDPACGGGVFLLAALDQLTDHYLKLAAHGTPRATVARFVATEMLFGLDKNPDAIAETRDALSVRCGFDVGAEHLRVGDALVGRFPGELDDGDTWPADWTLGGTVEPFHWDDEWASITCWLGNPPFLGGIKISSVLGKPYQAYLKWLHKDGYHGNADLCAHFLRRCEAVSNPGTPTTMSFICTNTICQGGTRRFGLAKLLEWGWVIYDAAKSMPWPGDAAVHVSVVHLARGF